MGEGVASWVAEALMPQIDSGCGEAVMGGGRVDRVKFSVRFTAEDHLPCATFLDRETNIIKFNVNRIVTG